MRKPSPEEAEIASLKRQLAHAEKIARLNAKNARINRNIAILRAANRVARAHIERRAAKTKRLRAGIDRRIGRYTVDVIVFGLIAAAWWFTVIDRIVQAAGR